MSALEVFLLHLTASLVAYLAFGRSRDLPAFAKFVTIVIYLNVPIYIAVQAAQSAIYLSDALAPVLAYRFFTNRPMQATFKQPLAISTFGFLFFLPIFLFMMNGIIGRTELNEQREIFGAILWYYRQFNAALIFIYGLSLRLDTKGLSAFVHLNFIMGSVLVGFAIINYVFNVNLAVFDKLLTVNTQYSAIYLEQNRIGYGFLGLFRASAGQWCATLAILFLGLAATRPIGTRVLYLVLAVCLIGCVLATLSRAGVVALAVGLVALSLLGRGMLERFLAVVGIGLGAYLVFDGSGVFVDRITSIFEASDSASQTRIVAWTLAINHLMTDPLTLLLGIGPYNEARISSITGAWGAHNEILDVALKLGIAGLTLWIMIIVALVKRLNSVRLVHHSLGKYRSTMLSILAANVAASFTQSHLLQGYATYTACIFLLWLYSVSASPRPDSKAQTPIAGDRHLPSQFS